jgi:putative methyltransferase (TIGR04325 family)
MDLPAPGPAPIFQGLFVDWPSVCEAAKYSGEGSRSTEAFNSDRWMTRQHEMLALARAGDYPRPTNLPFLQAICNPEFIVDLGGGSGWTSELLSKSKITGYRSYIVLEIPNVCREFSREFSEDSSMSFFSSISEAPDWMISRTDVLYSNSVLQYFQDYSTLTKLVSSLSPGYILLDDVITSTGETFYSLQNYYGISIPYCFSNLLDILKECTGLGYELLLNSEYLSRFNARMDPRIEGVKDSGFEIGRSRSLLFRKVA